MGEEIKRICPQCGGNQFMAYIKRGGVVESDGVDKDGNPRFKILKEGAKDNYEIEIIKCAKCRTSIGAADLSAGAKCKSCGEFVNPEELNETGICCVCEAMEADPTLKDASPRDILRRFLKRTAPVNTAVKAEVSAKAVEEKMAESASEQSADDMLNGMLDGGQQQAAPEAKTRRKKAQRKPAEAQQETVSNVPEQQMQAEESGQDIADAQEAPFPDVSGSMGPSMGMSQTEAQQTADVGFQMFDDESEQPF